MHSGNTDGSVEQMRQFSSGRALTGDGRTGRDNERSWREAAAPPFSARPTTNSTSGFQMRT
jgi:hypothetical protein